MEPITGIKGVDNGLRLSIYVAEHKRVPFRNFAANYTV